MESTSYSLGDAAMLIDPFTGEGIGNGMISGIIAAQTVAAFIENPSKEKLITYQATIERQLGSELRLSSRLQQLANYPRLFNFVVKTAANNSALQDTFSTMFYDVNIRAKLKNPLFYIELLFSSFKSKK
jgi:flavin-dependent dehydrogenase